MKIHEYQGKNILRVHGLPVPKGYVATTATEAEFAMLRLRTPKAVVKAQIHAGGRGKAGGVKLVHSPQECYAVAKEMLGRVLVTAQTGDAGREVKRVYVEEAAKIEREFYFAILVDRDVPAITLIASTQGGVDIEEVAAKDPKQIVKVHINPRIGLCGFYLHELAVGLGLQGTPYANQLPPLIEGLYRVFNKCDLSLLEINPLAIVDGKLTILDTKITTDDNAHFRQEEFQGLRDFNEEDERDIDASKARVSYIGLQGSIGCLVNGAGLAMATMDIIKYYGGQPANFLDIGGGSNEEQVKSAFRIILKDPSVGGIYVNIFGGIMHCDVIANGMVAAAQDLNLQIPLVIRLEGTNVEKGKKILQESNLQLIAADSMAEGARKIVEIVKGKAA